MPGTPGLSVLKPQRYQGKFITVGVRPGEPLPAGVYHNAWKLDPSYGRNILYIIYEPALESLVASGE